MFLRSKMKFMELHQSPTLTPREKEVAIWTLCGGSNKEIAYILSISPKTVGGYMEKILNKMQAMNRAHMCAIVILNGNVVLDIEELRRREKKIYAVKDLIT